MKLLKILIFKILFFIYILISRFSLYLLTFYAIFYFALNTKYTSSRIEKLLHSILPGNFRIERIDFSPLFFDLNFKNVEIFTPQNEKVISVQKLKVRINPLPIFKFAISSFYKEKITLHIIFSKITLEDFKTNLIFNENGELSLVHAFVEPEVPSTVVAKEPSTPVELNFKGIYGSGGSAQLSFPQWGMNINNISFSTILKIKEDGNVLIKANNVSFENGEGFIKENVPLPSKFPRKFKILPSIVKDYDFRTDRFNFSFADIKFNGGRLTAKNGMLIFEEEKPLKFKGSAEISLSEKEGIISNISGDLLRGETLIKVSGSGTFDNVSAIFEVYSPELIASGISLKDLALTGSYERDSEKNYKLLLNELKTKTFEGSLNLKNIVFYPFGLEKKSSGTLNFENISLSKIFSQLNLSFFENTGFKEGVSTGRVNFEFEETNEIKKLATDISIKNSLKHKNGFIDKLKLKGNIGLSFKELSDISLIFENFKISIPSTKISVNGIIQPFKNKENFSLNINSNSLSPITSLFIPTKILKNGKIKSTIKINGDILNPDIMGNLEAHNIDLYEYNLNSIKTDFIFKNRKVSFKGLNISSDYGNLFLNGGLKFLDGRIKFDAEELKISRLNINKIPFNTKISGICNMSFKNLKADLKDPISSLSGKGSFQIFNLIFEKQKFPSIFAKMQIDSENFNLSDLDIKISQKGEIKGIVIVSKDLKKTETNLNISIPSLSHLTIIKEKVPHLKGELSSEISVNGSLNNPEIKGKINLKNMNYGEFDFGDADINFSKNRDQNMFITSKNFIKNINIGEKSLIVFKDGVPEKLLLQLDLNKLNFLNYFLAKKTYDIDGMVSGKVFADIPFSDLKNMEMDLVINEIKMGLLQGEIKYRNSDEIKVFYRNGKIKIENFSLNDGKRGVFLCGNIDENQNLDLIIQGYVGLRNLKILRNVISNADGYIWTSHNPLHLNSMPEECSSKENKGSFHIRGNLKSPEFEGGWTFTDAEIQFRKFPEIIKIHNGGEIYIKNENEKNHKIIIKERKKITGKVGDGEFSLYGYANFENIFPADIEVNFKGVDLKFSSPREFYVIFNPQIKLIYKKENEEFLLSGSTSISEGMYYKNFDIVRSAIKSVGGKEVEREFPPLTHTFPFLENLSLDLQITSNNFNIKSALPFGETDFSVQLDMKVSGMLKEPKIYNRIEVVPGGFFLYKVGNREFEITKGIIDFSGNPHSPYIALEAKTEIEYTSIEGRGGSYSKGVESEGIEKTEVVNIILKVYGSYPDLNIELTSDNKDFSETDLQFLILTGMPKSEFEKGGGFSSDASINLFTEDIANLVTNLLLSPFVDAISFGVTYEGGIDAEVLTRLGSHMKIQTRVVQQSGGSKYSAKFQFKISDRLSLEGKIKAIEMSDEQRRQYESKLRYRIPLD